MQEPTDLAGALARILQSLRAERGWSLDQLALRSGVSKGVLVALEQGRSNPNLATLARIGDAFGVPVTRLLDVPDEPAVRITSPHQARVLWRGEAGGTGTIIAATDPPWAAELWRWTVQPGERFGGENRQRAGHQGDDLGRVGHGHADRGRPRLPGRRRSVRQVPRGPAALIRQRGHGAGADDDGRRRPPGPGLIRTRSPRRGVDHGRRKCFELVMSENWAADARVGVPMFQVIAQAE